MAPRNKEATPEAIAVHRQRLAQVNAAARLARQRQSFLGCAFLLGLVAAAFRIGHMLGTRDASAKVLREEEGNLPPSRHAELRAAVDTCPSPLWLLLVVIVAVYDVVVWIDVDPIEDFLERVWLQAVGAPRWRRD